MAISTRLNTRQRTAFATATGLPRYARNDIRAQSKGPASPLVSAVICHCEEHSDAAISTRLSTRRRTAFATATGLPRYARNDIRGQSKGPAVLTRTRCNLSLRGTQRRGNLDEVEHASANRLCYGDGIAPLRSQ